MQKIVIQIKPYSSNELNLPLKLKVVFSIKRLLFTADILSIIPLMQRMSLCQCLQIRLEPINQMYQSPDLHFNDKM